MGMTLLGGLTPQQFLKSHWQRRPLLVRGAWPGFAPPFAARDILKLAGDERAAPRRVWQAGGNWQVEHGPFTTAELRRPPGLKWTVLVPDVDKLMPATAPLLDHFSFLPGWRLDDLMVSYAVHGGSVGPHVDEYDVFLLQGHGRRRWAIQTRGVDPNGLRTGTGLKILRRFQAEQEWLLEPGDLLYLPPGVAHYGVADGECTTLSIGFRAPSSDELAAAWSEEGQRLARHPARYRDSGLHAPGNGQLDIRTRRRLLTMAAQAAAAPAAERERWLGRFLTEPGVHSPDPPIRRLTSARLNAALTRPGARFRRHPAVRALWFKQGRQLYFYLDGDEYQLPASRQPLAEALSATGTVLAAPLQPASLPAEIRSNLLIWFNKGIYLFVNNGNNYV
jgi:50S ribosomal protein L16 3-hydroxylase